MNKNYLSKKLFVSLVLCTSSSICLNVFANTAKPVNPILIVESTKSDSGECLKADKIGESCFWFDKQTMKYVGIINDKKLFAANADEPKSLSWACHGNSTGSTALNDGLYNSNSALKINPVCEKSLYKNGTNYEIAFDSCLKKGNGYYVPSKNELQLMYKNKKVIGNFDADFYWTSNEYFKNEAVSMDFVVGKFSEQSWKGTALGVRCVRSY